MSIVVGDNIPEWVMDSVSPARMRTMAAILRDPNPIHWDRDAVDSLPLGLGKRTINQGPSNRSIRARNITKMINGDCFTRQIWGAISGS